jgi:hypothetical protein
MELKAGDVIYAYCAFVPGNKFLICLCPSPPYFFFINSEPRRQTPDAQIEITKKDLAFLKHVSYINTATICTIYPEEIIDATPKGPLPAYLKEKILKVIDGSRYLSANQQAMIKTNLGPTSSLQTK